MTMDLIIRGFSSGGALERQASRINPRGRAGFRCWPPNGLVPVRRTERTTKFRHTGERMNSSLRAGTGAGVLHGVPGAPCESEKDEGRLCVAAAERGEASASAGPVNRWPQFTTIRTIGERSTAGR